ncbi:MAG: beta-ketoacyl-[acyl-carrier-protein] synthase II [Verrucomicrobia bacterium]|nr:MAG: beta-ketoacyl-[acyl-carrier-protein] synthase II [Verrucomicrobiota bacterium]
MAERRVVITGMGVVTPVGNDLETFWSNLRNGVSGIRTIDAFDTSGYDCKIGGQVRDFDPKPFFNNPKDVRRTDRFTHLAMAAAKKAMADSGIDISNLKQPDRFGVIVSTGIGGLKTLQDQLKILLTKGPGRNSPFTIPMLISNMAGGVISMEFGLRGPNLCIVTACATSNNAIGESWRIIKSGDADIFLAGGAEASIVEIGVAGFSAMKALSTRELEHARQRGAKIYCEITGYGVSADAYHMTAPPPDGEGAARAMKLALEHARVSPEQVDYINAHATSTDIGDLCETRAIKEIFGEHAYKVSISATKSMTGHLLGGAGGIEMAACALAIRDSIIPPTINFENPGEECDLDYTPKIAREKKVRVALNNSFGFGGHNATLVAAAFEE